MPDAPVDRMVFWKAFAVWDGSRPISLTAGNGPPWLLLGSRPDRVTGHIGNLQGQILREAAVGNIAQWAQA